MFFLIFVRHLKLTKVGAQIDGALGHMIDTEHEIGVGKKLVSNDASKE